PGAGLARAVPAGGRTRGARRLRRALHPPLRRERPRDPGASPRALAPLARAPRTLRARAGGLGGRGARRPHRRAGSVSGRLAARAAWPHRSGFPDGAAAIAVTTATAARGGGRDRTSPRAPRAGARVRRPPSRPMAPIGAGAAGGAGGTGVRASAPHRVRWWRP